jgi:hypothetical protein
LILLSPEIGRRVAIGMDHMRSRNLGICWTSSTADFQFDSYGAQIQGLAKSLDAQVHSETDIQHEIMGRKITRKKGTRLN